MATRVLETVLTGRNLLSPVLATAGRDVAAFDATVSSANTKAATSATTSARTQQTAAAQVAAAHSRVATSATTTAATQTRAHAQAITSAQAMAAAQGAAAQATISANARVAGAVTGTTATYQRSAASLREKLGMQALEGAAADRSAAANSRAAASAAVFTKAIDSNSTALARDTAVSSGSTAAVRANTVAREQATMATRLQATATGALASSNGLLGTSLTPLTAGLGAVGLGLGYASYRGMEFDAAMSQVQAASQASAGDMERLRESAITLGADTQYSAEEAAQGVTELAKAGVSTADVLGGGLKGALDLAAAGQMEVADAAEVGATALSVFRLEGSQMSHVADLLAAGAGKAQGSVHDLGMALNQSALVADQTGLSIEDTAGALAMFASNGLVGSDAGTSFKTMLQALNPNSLAAAKAMEAIGFSAYDAQGNFVGLEGVAAQLKDGLSQLTVEQQNATLKTIFGSDAVRAAAILYKEGAGGVREWRDSVNDSGYAARQAQQLTDNLKGDLERLGGAFDSAMTSIGDGTQGALRFLVQTLTAIVDVGGDVIGFWNDLPGPVQIAVGAFAAFTMLRGPMDRLFERIAVGITSTVTGMGMAAGATTGLGTAAGVTRTAIGGLVRAAAPLAGIMILTSAITSMVEFTRAGDDARESVKLFNGSLEDMGNTARSAAVAGEIDRIRESIAGYQEFIDGYEGQNLFNKHVWSGIGEPGELRNADQSIAALKDQLANLEGQSTRTAETTAVLAERFRLSKTEVQELADKYGIDLSGAIAQTRILFGQFYTEEFGTGPVDAANAVTGAVVSAKEQTEEAIKAQERWLEDLQGIAAGFVEPLGAYQALLDEKMAKERESAEATAAATEDATDSWEDYATDVTVSLDELATRLEDQLTAQDEWRQNIATITQRGGLEVGQILAAMGEEGVQLAAQMANGTDAEFNRMADLLIEDARRGGAGAAAALDQEMKVMAEVGRLGAGATAAQIAEQLGIGVHEVADIAARFGVNLALGINPILVALGRDQVRTNARIAGGATVNSLGLANGGLVDYYANGGVESHVAQIAPAGAWRVWAEPETGGEAYIPLAPAKRERSLEIWRETGQRLGAPEAEYFADGGFSTAADVPRPYSTAPYRTPISTAGDAAMQKGFDEVRAWLESNVGVAGTGTLAGTGWQPIWNYVKARVPQARINSTLRPGDPGRHGRGLAVDFGYGTGPGGAGSAGLALINRVLHDGIGASLAELIYTGIGDDRPDLRMGRPHVYSPYVNRTHTNHVHAAREKGGPVWPGVNFLVGENGPEIARFDAPATVYPNGTAPAAMPGYGPAGGAGVGLMARPVIHARVFIGDREITDIARIEATAVYADAQRQQRINDRSA